MSPKRNDRVAPPPEPGGWEFRFLTNEAARGWDDLCRQAPGNARRAYEAILGDPEPMAWSRRRHRLAPPLDERIQKGRPLAQWQYEVTGGGRLWYLVDTEWRTIWLSHASTGHPKHTE